MKTFSQFSEDKIIENRNADTPITIKELINKLQLILDNGSEPDDYVFFTMPGKDSGNVDNLFPVVNVSSLTIKFLKDEAQQLQSLLYKDGTDLAFISKKTHDV